MTRRTAILRFLSLLAIGVLGVLIWDRGNRLTTRFIEPETGDYVVETTSLLSHREVSREPTILGPNPEAGRVVVSSQRKTWFYTARSTHRGGLLREVTILDDVAEAAGWPGGLRARVSDVIWSAYLTEDDDRLHAILDAASESPARVGELLNRPASE